MHVTFFLLHSDAFIFSILINISLCRCLMKLRQNISYTKSTSVGLHHNTSASSYCLKKMKKLKQPFYCFNFFLIFFYLFDRYNLSAALFFGNSVLQLNHLNTAICV